VVLPSASDDARRRACNPQRLARSSRRQAAPGRMALPAGRR
jgi:hypothetical protein